MSLADLSAVELARIDEVSIDYERRLRAGQPTSLAAVLAAYDGAYPELLREELEQVRHEVQAETATGFHATPNTARASDDGGPLRQGDTVGRYRIERLIGRGGMGWVYAADDPRLGRQVAIKVLGDAWIADSDRVKRFNRETRAVAALQHPAIVALHDVGIHDRRSFAVMELLHGQTLRQQLIEGPLPAEEVRRIGIAVAEALEVAHGAGIVHRDLKPENIFLTSSGQLKLLDFGLARWFGDVLQPIGAEATTASGIIAGTVGYLAPEQVRNQPITDRADIFSLGCVLHECLYGRRAFPGSTVGESLAAVLHQEPAIEPTAHVTDSGLAAAIRKCLAKEPSERPSDAMAVARLLDRGAGSDRPKTNRRRFLVTAIGSVGVTGMATVAGSHLLGGRSPLVGSLAVVPLEGLPGDGERMSTSQSLAFALTGQLAKLPHLQVRPTHAVLQALRANPDPDRLHDAADQLQVEAILTVRPYPAEAPTHVSLQLVMCDSRTVRWGDEFPYNLQLDAEGAPLLAHAEFASRVTGELGSVLLSGGAQPLEQIGTTSEEAYLCLLHGESLVGPDNEAGLRKSLQCYRKALARDPQFPDAQAGMALSCVLLAQLGVADHVELVTTGRTAANRALASKPNAAEADLALGALAWQHDFAPSLAERHFAAAAERLANDWKLHHQLAMWHAFRGDDQSARRAIDRATALHPLAPALQLLAARLTWFAGDPEVAMSIAIADQDQSSDALGLQIDIIEQSGRLAEAARLWDGPAERGQYWLWRDESLAELPYMATAQEMNRLIMDVRSGRQPTNEALTPFFTHDRHLLLPLLLRRHPALSQLNALPIVHRYLPSHGS